MKPYTVISTFCGIGGSSQGYKQAGYNVLASVEFMDYQARTYRLNHPQARVYEGDIRNLDPLAILSDMGLAPGELDVFDGSPPCSSFSTCGIIDEGWGKEKQYGNKKQRTDDLFWEYIRFLRAFKPKVFVAENVSGLIKGVSKGHFNAFLQAFADAGYTVHAKLMNSANYGVAQIRQRVIFQGVRKDLNLTPVYPTPSGKPLTVRQAIAHIPANPSEKVSLTDLQLNYWRQTRPGQSMEDAYKADKGKGGWFSNIRLHPNKPCNTLTTHAGGDLYHWSEPRLLYTDELKAIQSFPPSYILEGERARRIEGIGRSVPPKMMEAIARCIADNILDKIHTN